MNSYKKKTIQTAAAIVLSIFLFFSSGIQIPVLDSVAQSYFKDSITKAGVSYGVCRLINGTVSVIQESSVQLEPAGIGMSLAVGQIVDPINDMVERLSDILVLSIASLGVQEIVYQISIVLAPPLLSGFLLLLCLSLWLGNEKFPGFTKKVLNLLLIVSIARFCLPLSSAANEFLHINFFEDRIVEANASLTDTTVELNTLKEVELPEFHGVLKTLENSASYLKNKSVDFKNAVKIIVENKVLIVENLLKLTFLYLGVFVIQILVLPVLIFWFLMRLVRLLL